MASAQVSSDRVQCRLCSRWVSRKEVAGAEARGFTCVKCLEWHFHALDVLGGAEPKGCQGYDSKPCTFGWDDFQRVKENATTGEVRLYAVPKDGIYQLLCNGCKERYVRSRRDIYGKTSYGASLKLK